ncbi:MAG TPA: CDP-alcohol phosphatidyltransferase family protein [Beijerinckiaceae bacterium]|nr:CDP-alcohol phosphatidyltransferase family protein [Beijerinckiaceae bacterium]
MNLANWLTLLRLCLVPLVVLSIIQHWWQIAFLAFAVAGVSDAVDGYVARRFNQVSELGALLDPIADKALLVSIYVTLAIAGAIPAWLTILVVSRDMMIVGAVIVSWILGNPVEIRPIYVSKANTVAQIVFAGFMLFASAFTLNLQVLYWPLIAAVCVLTSASMVAYLVSWARHMTE